MRTFITLRGKNSEWMIDSDMSQSQIDAMRADGLDVNVIEGTVPLWVAAYGLAGPWLFAQKLLTFRNPFAR